MIKSLLDADENPPPGTKVIIEETVVAPSSFENASTADPFPNVPENENILEIPELKSEPEIYELKNESESFQLKRGAEIAELKSEPEVYALKNEPESVELKSEPENASELFDSANQTTHFQTDAVPQSVEPLSEQSVPEQETVLFQSIEQPQNSGFVPETQAETIRKSGLAYAAAISLFGSIVFLLVIGWFADTLLGTDPWGKAGGIVLGAIIGFLQFFRMTSQILKNKD